ncbi:ketoacyl-synt-domain-containing protein [Trametes punicea]|nr:ketoacyl-synt-domain-containing protein [Trametes punicea]
MAVELPGAQDVDGLWELLERGLNTVQQIPQHRFDVSAFRDHDGPVGSGRSMSVNKGNFVESADAFDNLFFQVSPREARSMDPQQRMLLKVAYKALEHAGYCPNATPSFNPDTFATFVGVATNDYVLNLRNDIDVYYSTGTLQAFLSGRISYVFGFGGPSIVFDTACSSSMVALHQACRALTAGDCNAALAGGVNVISSPDMYLGLARGHFLSESGQCRPWDASADGYCRAEGCGLFVLKRLEDAVAEDDRILAVIRGIEVNQSGNARSITHPHVPAQVALFEKLVAAADVDPRDISVVECHGTGTQAGDPAELEAVRTVFAVGRTQDDPLHITSIKANIGHAEAASGAASLAKLILMMRERTIPRHISFQRLNPSIPDLTIDNVRIDKENVPWQCRRETHLALLTNFGAAGSNVALILEEYLPPPRQALTERDLILGLSCKSSAAAEQRRQAYMEKLKGTTEDKASLRDFAYTATARRQLHPYRLAASGGCKEELLASLHAAKIVEVRPCSQVIFVFSGQGSQYVGMGADLYQHIPPFARIVDDCHKRLVASNSPGILDIFRKDDRHIDGTFDPLLFRSLQAALFVLEYALARVWMAWGVQPCAVVGHSFGEFAALTIAGALDLDVALKAVSRRAEVISVRCQPYKTGMTSVKASAEELAPLLGRHPFCHLEVCCYNSGSNCVVGGDLNELQAFEVLSAERGVRYTRLDVPYAYHSAAMDPALGDLERLSDCATISAPKIPVLSNVTGTLIHPGDSTAFAPGYFARHCREPARFQQGMAELARRMDLSSVATCIEVGPHPTTLPLLRGLQADEGPLLLPSLRRDDLCPGLKTLCGALAQLYCTSVPVQWRKVYADLTPGARVVDLPAYPFAETRFWVPYQEESPCQHEGSKRSGSSSRINVPRPRFALLDRCLHLRQMQEDGSAVYETDVASLADLIQGHEVAGVPLCPASVYAELALAAGVSGLEARCSWGEGDVLDLVDVVCSKPLVYVPGREDKLRVEVVLSSAPDKGLGSFSICSTSIDEKRRQVHCKGSFKRSTSDKVLSKLSYAEIMLKREIDRVNSPDPPSPPAETLNTRTVYDLIFPSVVSYAEAYRTIETVTVNSVSSSAYATIRLPSALVSASLARSPRAAEFATSHPVFIDTLFQVAGFLINFTRGMGGAHAYICSSFDRLQLVTQAVGLDTRYGVYATAVREERDPSGEVIVLDVYALEAGDSRRPGRIVARLKRARFRKVVLATFSKTLQAAMRPLGDGGAAWKDVVHLGRAARSIGRPSPHPTARLSDLKRDVLVIIASATGLSIEDIRTDAQLAHLGVDSLMLWEVAARLREVAPAGTRELDSRTLAEASTVRDLVVLVEDACSRTAPLSEASISREDSVVTLFEDELHDLKPSAAGREKAGDAEREVLDIHAVRGVLSSVLDIPAADIADDVELQSLGLDSLTSIEARHVFRTRLGVMVKEETLFACRTVRDVARSVLAYPSRSSSEYESVSSPAGFELVRLQRAPSSDRETAPPPLILVHDGSGDVGGYARLDALGRDVWAIKNANLASCLVGLGAERGSEVVRLAGAYAQALQDMLFDEERGWSFGGVVAYELATHLAHLGVEVKGLILIDAPAPQTQSPLPEGFISALAGRLTSSGRDSTPDIGDPRERDAVRASTGRPATFVEQMRTATRALVAYSPDVGSKNIRSIPRAVYLRARGAVEDSLFDSGKFGHEDVDERVRAFLTKREDAWTLPLWEEALGGQTVRVMDVPGNHFGMFSLKNIPVLSEKLAQVLRVLLS